MRPGPTYAILRPASGELVPPVSAWAVLPNATVDSTALYDIAYSATHEIWVAVGNGAAFWSEDDGATWTACTGVPANLWYRIVESNGTFMAGAVGGTNRLMRSTDGKAFTASAIGHATTAVSFASDGLGNWIMGGGAGITNDLLYSTDDGVSWARIGSLVSGEWYAAGALPGYFVIGANNSGAIYAATTPGGTYAAVTIAGGTIKCIDTVVIGGELLIIPQNSGASENFARWNGSAWSKYLVPAGYRGSTFSICRAPNGILMTVAVGSTPLAAYSLDDGVTWTSMATPSTQDYQGVDYGHGRFLAVSTGGTNRVARLIYDGG